MSSETTSAATVVYAALAAVAPDRVHEIDRLDQDADIWQALDLDSLDHLAVMTSIAHATAHDVAEHDYPGLLTIRQLCAYVATFLE